MILEEVIRKMLEKNKANKSTPLKKNTSEVHSEHTSICSKEGNTNKARITSFSRREKLKSKKLIEQLFIEGSSVSSYPIKLIYLKTELPFNVPMQVGVTVPKKNFKSAVHRNRIKRLLREGYRLNKEIVFNNSESTFAFLFLYLGKGMPEHYTINQHIQLALHKFKKKIDHE